MLKICLSIAAIVVLQLALGAGAQHQPDVGQATCVDCLRARYWNIPEKDFERPGDAVFPERDLVKDRLDLGITFSGGGTRSAAATLGQLRGLQRLDWLRHVRYVSAVSGGGWAAIPFVYGTESIEELLGTYAEPNTLTLDAVQKAAVGRLGAAIASSSLASGALVEGPATFLNIRNAQQTVPNPLLSQIVSLTNRLRREGTRDSKTYSRLLGRIFIDGLVSSDASARLFSWNGETIAEMSRLNPDRLGAFVIAHPDRPFLIAGGTLVSARADYTYPLLMPVEYTPMYVGVRQRFGRFGGTYVWPWAYDPVAVGRATPDPSRPGEGTIEVKIGEGRRLTLADVASSTGAAPEIPLLLGLGLKGPAASKIQQAAALFPRFHSYAVRDDNRVVFTDELAHGDGGGIENLGLMPLLARHVHNIIVFNNTSTPLVEENSETQALFMPNATSGVTSDPRGNQVFAPELWDVVVDAIVAKRERREPQVFCGVNWSVRSNARYNIRAYDGLNICFVYNASAQEWERALRDPVAKVLHDRRDANFPYFRTFGQNFPHVIQLTKAQVNLLSNLTAWTISNEQTATIVRTALPVLPCPRDRTCNP